MPSLTERLRLLEHASPAARTAILLGSVQNAEAQELHGLIAAMLATQEPLAVAWVLKNAQQIGAKAFAQLDSVAFSLSPAIRLVVVGDYEQHLLSVVEAIRRRGEAELAVHLADLIEIGTSTVAESAAEALLELAANGGRGNEHLNADPHAWSRIDRAVARAARDYRRHRLDAVLIAAAALAHRPGQELTRLLSDPQQEFALTLRSAAGKVSNVVVRRNLLRWLILDEVGAMAGRSIHKLSGARDFGDLLLDGHLMRTPARQRMLRRVDHPEKCLPSIAEVGDMPVDAQAHLPQLAMSLGLTQAQRVAFLSDCIAVPNALGRLNALRELEGFDSFEAQQAAARFCLDRCRPISSVAVGSAVRAVDDVAPGLLARLAGAGGPDLKLTPQAARLWRALARRSVDSFFEHWTRVEVNDRLAAGLALLNARRGDFVSRMRRFILEGDRPAKLAAMALIRRLRLVADLRHELIELIGSADARIAATATSALGDLQGEQDEAGMAALRAAIEHEDARVRANAVESLVRAGTDRIIEVVMPMCSSRDSRSRANAVRGLVRHRPDKGLEQLREMLRDEDPLHRTSAVWVANRSAAAAAADELRRVSEGDAQPELRIRAEAALRLLNRRHADFEPVVESVP